MAVLLLLSVVCVRCDDGGVGDGVYDIRGSVKIPHIGADHSPLTECRVIINNGAYTTRLHRDGTFVVTRVPAGTYFVEFDHRNFSFISYRVDISARPKTPIRWSALYPIAKLPNSRPTIAATNATYFHVRPPLNVLSYLMQPMTLMIVMTVVVVIVMPRMMSGMNESEKEEMARMQRQWSVGGLIQSLESKVQQQQHNSATKRIRE